MPLFYRTVSLTQQSGKPSPQYRRRSGVHMNTRFTKFLEGLKFYNFSMQNATKDISNAKLHVILKQ